MQKRIECIVSGRVQGVMYRDFVLRKARKLGLSGFVQNAADGAVTIVAEGEEANLKTLIGSLCKGSFFSKVTDVKTVWSEAKRDLSTFVIMY